MDHVFAPPSASAPRATLSVPDSPLPGAARDPSYDPEAAAAAAAAAAAEPMLQLLLGVQSLIYSTATASNLVVLAVLAAFRRKQRLSRMYQLIAHLCLADLAVATFNILPNLLQLAHDTMWTVPSDFLCKVVSYFSLTAIYASTYVLVMTAIDRYVAICHPLALANVWKRSVHALAAVAWLTALAFSAPQLAVFRYSLVDGEAGDCWASFHDDPAQRPRYELAYVLWFALAVWIAPMVALTFCYVNITVAVWRSRHAVMTLKLRASHIAGDGGSSVCSSKDDKAFEGGRVLTTGLLPKSGGRWLSADTRRTVKLTLTVIASYVICWSPWMVSSLLTSIIPERSDDPVLSSLQAVAYILQYFIGVNSCVNPWVYLCFNAKRLCGKKTKTPGGGSSKSAACTCTAHTHTSPTTHAASGV